VVDTIDVVGGGRFVGQRSIGAGAPLTHVRGTPGLAGLAVRTRDTGITVLLSCAHVLAPRDAVSSATDNVIESPSASGTAQPLNRIGVLQTFVPFGSTGNTIDAAICSIDAGIDATVGLLAGETVTQIWEMSPTDPPLKGRDVWRVDQNGGRMPGRIAGKLEAHTVRFHDGFDPVPFESVVRYIAPNSSGDSGGAVIDALTGRFVGLHFAGDGIDQCLLCLAVLMFSALNIRLD
jgi:hypothetical protein